MTDILTRLTASLADRYVIERELGAGGMATVYLAHDVRHNRNVALKVLRPELAAILGGERFLKEIQLTANLQHPHILPLHDSGTGGQGHGGTEFVFYVMPYVDGESLRDRLSREKQLPVEDAVRIAREVASALDYAHRHGVVHRDIKPENILLHDGQALVADFGIALAASTVGGGTRMTETGMSLGTPHYMAPEQAMGEREITARADIYALAVVLYESLTGDPPFTGSTAQAVVARVVTEAPRGLVLQRHTIPPHVEAAVLKALEKLPADRVASAAQFAEALGNVSFTTATAAAPATHVTAPRRRALLRWALAAPWAVSAALAAALIVTPRRADVPVSRVALALPADQQPLPRRLMAVAPDGSAFAYVGPGEGSGSPQLWLKRRDRHEATPVPGTAGTGNFAFSPDGEWLAFVLGGSLRKVPVAGGAVVTIGDSVSGQPGLAWLDDGRIVYVQVGGRALRAVPDIGGAAIELYRVDSGIVRYPEGLPGAKGVLFTICRVTRCGDEQSLWLLDTRSGRTRRLEASAARAWYEPVTGNVVFARRDGAVLALPLDAGSLEAGTSAVPVLDGIAVIDEQHPVMGLSREGTLLYRAGGRIGGFASWRAVWVDRAGRVAQVDTTWVFRLTGWGNDNGGWTLSPDGTRLAIGLETDAGDDVWIKTLPNGPLSRLSLDPAPEFRPRWHDRGRSVMFISDRSGRLAVYLRRADGTGSDSLVYRGANTIAEAAMSGDWLVFRPGTTAGSRDIMAVRPGLDSVAIPMVANTGYDEYSPAPSPDGRWLAYVSNETGSHQVYVRPFPNVNDARWQVSSRGGIAPLWLRDGRELLFVDSARTLTAVAIAPGAVFRAGSPRPLFRLPSNLYGSPADYYTPFDISPDGRRFMAMEMVERESGSAPLILVGNWFTELRQKTANR